MILQMISDMYFELIPGVWGEFVAMLIGGGALTTGLVGLLLGGRRLPPIEIPPRMQPFAKFSFVIMFLFGLTLISNAAPDLLERFVMTVAR